MSEALALEHARALAALCEDEIERGIRAAVGVPTLDEPMPAVVARVERRMILAALSRSVSGVAGAAALLGIKRTTLHYKMRQHGLGPSGSFSTQRHGEHGGAQRND